MKHKKWKLAKEKKKGGWVLEAVRFNEMEEVLQHSARFEEILFTCLYRQPSGHGLRWREAQRARRKFCGKWKEFERTKKGWTI